MYEPVVASTPSKYGINPFIAKKAIIRAHKAYMAGNFRRCCYHLDVAANNLHPRYGTDQRTNMLWTGPKADKYLPWCDKVNAAWKHIYHNHVERH